MFFFQAILAQLYEAQCGRKQEQAIYTYVEQSIQRNKKQNPFYSEVVFSYGEEHIQFKTYMPLGHCFAKSANTRSNPNLKPVSVQLFVPIHKIVTL